MSYSLLNTGKKFSEERRRKMSENMKGGKNHMYGRHLIPWNKGIPCTEETRRKISESRKGKCTGEKHHMFGKHPTAWNKGKKGVYFHSEKIRRKMSESRIGKRNSGQFKIEQSPWNKGKKGVFSKETIQKMSNARKGRFGGEKHPMFGEHHTKESKENMSAKRLGITSWALGKKFSKEVRKRISEGHKGQIAWNKGKKTNRPSFRKGQRGMFAEETLEKIRQARLKQKIPRKDTVIEKIIQNSLKKLGIDFSTHKPILGQPDIFIEPNFCIFLDGDYWHANPKKYSPDSLIIGKRTAKKIWEKDKQITKKLESIGYRVLRIWENEIKSNSSICAKNIANFSKTNLVIH